MGSPSRNVQYHPPRLSEDRLNFPQPHSPSLPTHCSGKSGMRPQRFRLRTDAVRRYRRRLERPACDGVGYLHVASRRALGIREVAPALLQRRHQRRACTDTIVHDPFAAHEQISVATHPRRAKRPPECGGEIEVGVAWLWRGLPREREWPCIPRGSPAQNAEAASTYPLGIWSVVAEGARLRERRRQPIVDAPGDHQSVSRAKPRRPGVFDRFRVHALL